MSKDLEPIIKELQNASKMHLRQSKIVKAHIKSMKDGSSKKSKKS